MKKNGINTGRSTCVICGKVRYRSYLRKLNDVWVCDKPVRIGVNDFMYINGSYHPLSSCTQKYLFGLKSNIDNQISNYYKVLFGIIPDYKTVAELNIIVRPEPTI